MMSLRPSCAELHGFSIRQKATSLILYIMFAECDGPSCMKDNGYLHQEERSRVNAGGCAPRTLLRSNIKDMQRKAGRLDQYTGSSITGSFGPTKAHGISIAPGTFHICIYKLRFVNSRVPIPYIQIHGWGSVTRREQEG
jgi:hypothetical protein